MRRALAAAALLLACASSGFAADKKQPAALPEVPETLSPAEADAFLAKLTDAQVRALLARELKARAKKEAGASAKAEPQGLGPLLMGVAHRLESEQFDFSQRTVVLAQGFAQLPAAVASGVSRIVPQLSDPRRRAPRRCLFAPGSCGARFDSADSRQPSLPRSR